MKKFASFAALSLLVAVGCFGLAGAEESTPAQGIVTNKAVKHALREAQSGKFLRNNGASTDPSWEDVSIASIASANKVYAGPTSGADATPAFRALVANDLPSALTPTTISIASGGGIGLGGATPTGDSVRFGAGGAYTTNNPEILGPAAGDLWVRAGDSSGFLDLAAGNGTGTDASGGEATIYMGQPTGSGAPGNFAIRGGLDSTSTGSSIHGTINRFYVKGPRVSLSNNSAQTLVTLQPLSAGEVGGLALHYTVLAYDGTNCQVESGWVTFTVARGSSIPVTASSSSTYGTNKQTPSGTLSVSFGTVLTGGNSAGSLQITANSSLSVTKLTVQFEYFNDSMSDAS